MALEHVALIKDLLLLLSNSGSHSFSLAPLRYTVHHLVTLCLTFILLFGVL